MGLTAAAEVDVEGAGAAVALVGGRDLQDAGVERRRRQPVRQAVAQDAVAVRAASACVVGAALAGDDQDQAQVLGVGVRG